MGRTLSDNGHRIGILAAQAFLLAACERPFGAIEPNDYVFSIYGHLEATADTQWVRDTLSGAMKYRGDCPA